MSGTTRIELFGGNENYTRKATPEELATVPAMTRDEARDVMRSEEYKTSSLVRELVKASIAKSDLQAQAGTRFDGSPQVEGQQGDAFLAKKETIATMMKDPRYKHSAVYRREVAEKIASLTQFDNAGVTADALKTPNMSVSISPSTSPYHGADLQVRKFNRVELATKADDSQAPVKPEKPVREPFSRD